MGITVLPYSNIIFFLDATVGITVAGQSGVSGPWAYLFSNPTALVFDQYGFMYVLDTGNKRIQRWWPGASYGITVASSTTLSSPYGLSIGAAGNMVVVDTANHRVISFSAVCREFFQQIFLGYFTVESHKNVSIRFFLASVTTTTPSPSSMFLCCCSISHSRFNTFYVFLI